ncbi:MAG: Carbohydrate binding family 6 [Fibrobacteres bacterium]|nr:Carbohydrate binding family 6 [Fibrobacterota bacterium]
MSHSVSMKRSGPAFALMACCAVLPAQATLPAEYKGAPFADSVYKDGAQSIPGRLEAAYYDLGGEGVAYHDADVKNQGSGTLNYQQNCPDNASVYICHFREKDATDPSYTKTCCDFTNANLDVPKPKAFYIGWEAKGEWLNYTVRVKTPGAYNIKAMYGNAANAISFSLNDKAAAQAKFPINTGSPHVWKYADSIGTIVFPDTGLNLLTWYLAEGNNVSYFDFVPAKGTTVLHGPAAKGDKPGLAFQVRRIGGGKVGVDFALARAGEARYTLLDMAGRAVARIPLGWLGKGAHADELDLGDYGSRAAFLRLESAGMESTRSLPGAR